MSQLNANLRSKPAPEAMAPRASLWRQLCMIFAAVVMAFLLGGPSTSAYADTGTGVSNTPQAGTTSGSVPAPAPAAGSTTPAAGSVPPSQSAANDTSNDSGVSNDQGDAASGAVDSFFATGAQAAMTFALDKLDVTASPQVYSTNGCAASQDGRGGGTCWFERQWDMMKGMAIWVMVPLIMISIIHAVVRGSMFQIVKTLLIYLPVSLLGMAMATQLVQLLLNITDDAANVFAKSAAANSGLFFHNLWSGWTGSTGMIPFWISALMALGMIISAIFVYVVLVLREASVYIATSFLPLGFAVLVWPSTARFFRKLVEFLIGMIFSKLFMVAAISLAMASWAGLGSDNTAGAATTAVNGTAVAAASSAGGGSGFSTFAQCLEAIALFGIVGFSPQMIQKLIGNMTFDGSGAAQAIGSALDKPNTVTKVLLATRSVQMAGDLFRPASSPKGAGMVSMALSRNARKAQAATGSWDEAALNGLGFGKNGRGDWAYTDDELLAKGIGDPADRNLIMGLTANNPVTGRPDVNDVALAHGIADAGSRYRGYRDNGSFWSVEVDNGRGGYNVENIQKPRINGLQQTRLDPALTRNLARQQLASGAAGVRFHVPGSQGGSKRDSKKYAAARDSVNRLNGNVAVTQSQQTYAQTIKNDPSPYNDSLR